jgi:hypothetical protein
MRTQNLSLVLAISKAYLKYGRMQDNLMTQIQSKIKSSLLAFINFGTPSLEYVALKHILYIIKKY